MQVAKYFGDPYPVSDESKNHTGDFEYGTVELRTMNCGALSQKLNGTKRTIVPNNQEQAPYPGRGLVFYQTLYGRGEEGTQHDLFHC